MDGSQMDDRERTERAMLEQAQAQLRTMFAGLQYDIPLLLFTSPGKNDLFSQTTRQVIRAVREITPKVSLLEFDLTHDKAGEWNATSSPTLLFDPEHYHIRWLGAPMGEEGKTFVEALLMLGMRETDISQESLKVLQKITSPRHIKIFVNSNL